MTGYETVSKASVSSAVFFTVGCPFVPPRCTMPEIDRVRRKSNALPPSEWQRTRMESSLRDVWRSSDEIS